MRGAYPEFLVSHQLRHTTRLQSIKRYFILVPISHKNWDEMRMRRALNLLISLLCRTALAASKLLTGAISFHRVNDIKKKKKLCCCDNPFLTQFNSSTFGEENTTVRFASCQIYPNKKCRFEINIAHVSWRVERSSNPLSIDM